MTTIFDATDAMVKRWISQWGTTTPYALEGEQYRPTRGTSWCRLSIRHTAGEQTSQGAPLTRRFTRRGEVNVQVFTPANGGTASGTQLAQQALDVFEGTTFSSVYFFDGRVEELGVDGEWMQHLVTCSFDYQQIK
jgi:hypothetical protein